ncbi:MAG TPA: MFS transporter [Microbacteriaceae bacterium]|nr:MFS transporter [Microbacteriaceae bacterium]HQZ47785.1 MFS transporter [Microbacteriaceae bacterium]HRA08474.1 MFS transporter [Microbacteriaceae bacterium]
MSTTAITPALKRYRRNRAMSTVAAFGAIMTSSTPVAMGFLVIPGSEHFGVTTAQFLIYFTLFLLTSAALFGFTGRLILRIGVRPVLITGGIISALAWVGMAYAPNIYVFYIFAFIMGVGASGNNLLPANTLITGWHVHKRRGTVLGLAATGAAFGGMIIGFVFPSIMAAGGFVGGALAIGAMIFICSTLTGIFLAKNPPRPGEENADDTVEATSKADRKAAIKGFGFTVVLLAIAGFLFSLENAFNTVQAAVYTTFGIDLVTAGLMISFFSLCGIVAKPLLGFMHDKLGVKVLLSTLVVLYILGLPALALSMQLGLNLTFPILVIAAISLSVPTVILPLLAVNAAGRERFPIIYGFMLTGSFAGTGIGVPLWGLVFDTTGSFALAMYGGGIGGLIGLGLAFYGLRRGMRYRQSMNETITTGIVLEEGEVTPVH